MMKKLSLYIFLVLMWCNVGFAHCSKGNCINGYGTFTFESGEFDGDEYVGEFKEGLFNGQGTFTFVNGDEYVGEFKDDKMHGQGTYTKADGTVYKGIFEKNKLIEEQ